MAEDQPWSDGDERDTMNSDDVVLYDQHGRVMSAEQRNLAFSSMLMPGMPKAQWTKWSVARAVKDGLKSSVWIYRSFGLISGSAAGVQLRVVDAVDGEPIDHHPLTAVLQRPNNQISRNDCFSLLYNWLLLTGLAYMLLGDKSASGKGTFPLWPVSPDRIYPIRNKDIDLMIDGYCLDKNKNQGNPPIAYMPEQIIPFRIMDPANPLLGMSPLFAAARVIDTDSEMQSFNKSAMQNRGVVDGLITFDVPLQQTQLDAQAEAWAERTRGSSNARKTAFLGNKASYKRMSLTPEEADFSGSRKSNRDEILSAVGTPPQLVGAQEASTMDNFRTSETIHWRNTIVPLIGVVVNQFNFFFQVNGLLKEGQVVAPDFSDVQALQQNFKDKTMAAEKLFKIGVPVMTISSMLKLGISEYDGWDLPYNGRDVKINPGSGQTTMSGEATKGDVDEDDAKVERATIKSWYERQQAGPTEARNRDKLAQERSKALVKILKREQALVEDVLKESPNPVATLEMMFDEDDPFETNADWEKELTKTARQSAIQEGKSIIIEQRAFDDELASAVDDALANEGVILQERSLIHKTTANLTITVVADGIDAGATIGEISNALGDVGAFSPERALRISRTITGTGSSVGQLVAGTLSGATHKVWRTAGFEVRELHQQRDGETVKIDERFTGVASENGAFPRYPLDPDIAPGDRINCRCSMTFQN
jgi:HK97 family phage portal protein